MKKRYPFLSKNWLRFGLTGAFAALFSINLQAQTAPAKQWDKTIGGDQADYLMSFKKTFSGGFILGGYSFSNYSGDKTGPPVGMFDYWIVNLNSNGAIRWDKTIGGNSHDILTCIAQTSDGGYILGGESTSFGFTGDRTAPSRGLSDYWIVKVDSNGTKQWDKAFGGGGYGNFNYLQQTPDGGYILGGAADGILGNDKTQNSKGSFDYWIVKISANGTKQWDKTIGGNISEEFKKVLFTSDGGYILGGSSPSPISGDKTQANKGANYTYDYWIVKLNANGIKKWDKTYGGDSTDILQTIEPTTDGGFILGGESDSKVSGDKTQMPLGKTDFWVVKIDSIGNKQWDRTFGGGSNDQLNAIKQTVDGGYILGGVSSSGISGDKSQSSQGMNDYWVVKTNSIGVKLWDATYGGNYEDYLTDLLQTSDGGYLLGGYSASNISSTKSQSSKGSSDYWIVKLAGSPTGIKEPEANFNFSISPNPNQGKFNLQLSNFTVPNAEVTVSDLLGRVVLQKEIHTTNNQLSEELSLSNAKGIYLLQLKTGGQFITRKIAVE